MTELNFTGDAAAESTATAATATDTAAATSPAAAPDTAAPAGANPWQIEHRARDGAVTKVDVPEPFRNQDGSVNIAAALKAHADLRQQLSTRPTAPEKYDFAVLIPDEAKSVLGDVLVDGAPLLPKAEAWGKKWNLPPEAMGEALTLLAERDGLMTRAGETDNSAAQEQAWAEAVQLVGSREKAEGIGRRFATALGLTDKDPPIGLPPQALPKLEKLLEKAGAGTVTTTRDVASAADVTEADLEAMMRDPKYWKQKDPAFIAQVTEGFQKLYGGQKQA